MNSEDVTLFILIGGIRETLGILGLSELWRGVWGWRLFPGGLKLMQENSKDQKWGKAEGRTRKKVS